MYADGGHLYVFLVYGMHCCANVVTRRAGVPEAVLLRAAEGGSLAPERLLSGPAQALRRARASRRPTAARTCWATAPCGSSRRRGRRPRLGVSPRIGVDYAGDAAAWPLRFFDSIRHRCRENGHSGGAELSPSFGRRLLLPGSSFVVGPSPPVLNWRLKGPPLEIETRHCGSSGSWPGPGSVVVTTAFLPPRLAR